MMAQDEDSGPVNLGNPVENSMLELAQTVIDVTGANVPIEHRPLPEDDPRRRCPDITKARNLLKWEPRVDLRTGLEQTVQYYRGQLAERQAG